MSKKNKSINISGLVPRKKESKPLEKQRAEAMMEGIEDLDDHEAALQVKKAIDVYPNLMDGHMWLAAHARTVEDALVHLKSAMEAGEAELGPEAFEEMKGHFWGFHETRPFMSAKYEYAMFLRKAKKYEQSLRQFKELLELNPNDNQGVRFSYAPLLVQTGKYVAYQKLIKIYEEEDMAHSLYTHAIYTFKKHGNSVKSNQALAKAYEANPYILNFFAGEVDFPDEPPSHYSLGSLEEAQIYLAENFGIFDFKKDKKIGSWIHKFLDKHL